MATTTNYSWSTPDDTALVKDGAAAIRSLGTAIDSTVFTNAGAAIAKTIVDAKGDIIAATAADTVARLAVGANDTILTADSSTATGLKWAAPAGGGKVLQVVQVTYSTETTNSTTSYADTGLSASITPSSATSKILVIATQAFEFQQGQDAAGGFLKILRDATGIYEITGLRTNIGGASLALVGGLYTMNYLDSPATTASTTYKTQMRLESTGGTFKSVTAQYDDYGNATSTMILMEIGA
jgi:hypothetical protein